MNLIELASLPVALHTRVTVNTGPYKGVYDSLTSLMDAQADKMASCKHGHTTIEQGFCGKGERYKAWNRVRCVDCNDALDLTMTPVKPH